MSKKLAKAFVAAFVLLLIMPSIIFSFLGNHLDKTNYEQRQKAEKPVLTKESLKDYPRAFEAYYNDNMAFRTQMIEINSLLNYHLFKDVPGSKVIIGKDGWLFYNPHGTDGNPIADFTGKNLYTQAQLQEMADNLLSVRDSLLAQGKEFIIYIAPNKECIYGEDFLPFNYAKSETDTTADQVVRYLQENTDLTIVYPKAALQSAIETYPEYSFYHKTDTHWNALGSYIGANELLKELNIPMPDLDSVKITQDGKIAGDLAKMMSLSKHMQYDSNYTVTGYAKENQVSAAMLGERENILSYSTTGMFPQSLFVIHDSFAEAMIPYLSSQVNNNVFVHYLTYTPDLLAQFPSDIVVLQTVERYIFQLFDFTAE